MAHKKVKLTSKNDIFNGTNAREQILGLGGNDMISAGGGNDKLDGGKGNDTLDGGAGADLLTGGAGGDIIVYRTVKDSSAASGAFSAKSGDTINGFSSVADTATPADRDHIDLSAIVTTIGHSLVWSDTTASKYGAWQATTGNMTDIFIDTTGDAIADMVMRIKSVETLQSADFIGVTPGAPLAALTKDSGNPTDGITSVGTLTVTNVIAGASVEYSINGGTVWTKTFTPVEGVNTVQTRQTDVAGNVSAPSVATTFTLDTIAPVQLVASLANDTGTLSTDKISQNGAISAVGLENGASLQYSIDGGNIWTASFTPAQGNNVVQVRQIDQAGNVSLNSQVLSFVLDTVVPIAPTISLTLDSGSSGSDLVTNSSQLSFTGLEANAVIQYSLNNGTSWSTQYAPVNGANSVQIRQVDAAGNVSATSNSVAFTLDTIAPAVSITIDPVTFDNFLTAAEAKQLHTITGRCAGEFKAGDIVTLTINTTDYFGPVDAQGNFTIINVSGIELQGDIDLTIDVAMTTTDLAGNVTTLSVKKAYTQEGPIFLAHLNDAQGFAIFGEAAGDNAGRSVASAGDVNGDGFTDFIIGAPNNTSVGGIPSGAAYLLFGGKNHADLNLSAMTNEGITIQGEGNRDSAGYSIASAGDINGDGLDDILIGAPFAYTNGVMTGASYVVFGQVGLNNIDLANLGTGGFKIIGASNDSRAGFSVSSAGDFNGDGFDDFLVGANRQSGNGSTYIVFGGKGLGTVDLSNLGSQGLEIKSIQGGSYFGYSVSSAGDINGDGFADVIVGAPRWTAGNKYEAGSAFVIFGGAKVGPIDLATPGSAFIQISGENSSDHAGYSVSSAGDFNGDGYDDFVVGAPLNDVTGKDSGAAYVIFGGSKPATIDLANLGASGFKINGAAAQSYTGVSVSSAGDFNGDGLEDLLVGADSHGPGSTLGRAYIIFGRSGMTGNSHIDLATMTTSQGVEIVGTKLANATGQSVSSAGDINGDGYDDIMVGAPLEGAANSNSGAAYVIYGSALGAQTSGIFLNGTSGVDRLYGSFGDDVITGNGNSDIIFSGRGDDIIGVTTSVASPFHVDGGHGYDTIRLDGSNDVFNFNTIPAGAIESIEAFDLRVSGNQTLVLDHFDVLNTSDNIAGGVTRMTVLGTFGDTVDVTDPTNWNVGGTVDIGSHTFRLYTFGNAQLLLDLQVFLM